MAEISKNYTKPSNVCWSLFGDADSYGAVGEVPYTGTTLYARWSSQYKSFQVQWRVSTRMSPATAEAEGYTVGGEVWTDWGDWEGNDITQDVATASKRNSGGTASVMTEGFTFGYAFDKYDKREYQFRVRAFDTSSHLCSEWGYGTVTVVYKPRLTGYSCTLNSDGSASLTLQSNWTRGASIDMGSFFAADGSFIRGQDVRAETSDDGGDITCTVPAKYVSDGHIYVQLTRYVTCDQAWSYGDELPTSGDLIDFTVGHADPTKAITEPTFADGGDGVWQATVTVTGSGYTNVLGWARWTDWTGAPATAELAVTKNSTKKWTLALASPPFGVPITVSAACIVDGEFIVRTHELTVDYPNCVWTEAGATSGAYIELMYDQELGIDFDTGAETVQLAGDTLPTSRYSRACPRSISISGNALPSQQARSAWEPLREPHDWLFRTPDGLRARVALTSLALSEDNRHITGVSAKMEEVTDGD